MNKELADFHKSSPVESGLSTTTCLFPQEKLGTVKDVRIADPQSYLVDAGTRLVTLLKGTASASRTHDPPLLSSSAAAKPNSIAFSLNVPKSPPVDLGSTLKQSFLIRKDGSVLLSKDPPLVDAVGMTELKRGF